MGWVALCHLTFNQHTFCAQHSTSMSAYLYNGEATDITTGLQYLCARYYDPETGRFVQEDTVLGSLTRPLTQNLYAYCGNNPLNYMDPSGHDWWSDLGDGLSNAWSQVTNWAENTSQQIGNWFDARTQEASHYLTEKIDQAKEKITAVKCMDWKSFSRRLVYELLYNTSTTIMSPVDMLITISGVNLPTFRELVQDDYLISGDPYMYYLGKVTGDVIALAIGVAATVVVSITEAAAGGILVANSVAALSIGQYLKQYRHNFTYNQNGQPTGGTVTSIPD